MAFTCMELMGGWPGFLKTGAVKSTPFYCHPNGGHPQKINDASMFVAT